MLEPEFNGGWRVHIEDGHEHFLRNRVAIVVYRPVGDGQIAIDDLTGEPEGQRYISTGMRAEPPIQWASINRDAVYALRDALNVFLGDAPDSKAEKVLRETLEIERDRVNAILYSILPPVPNNEPRHRRG